MTIARQKIPYMLQLVDDNDKEVVASVVKHLLQIAFQDYGAVEEYYLDTEDMGEEATAVLEEVLEKARLAQVSDQLKALLDRPELDWVEMLNIVTRLQYVNISSVEDKIFIKGIVNAIELEITPAQLDKTKVRHLITIIHSMYDFKPCNSHNAAEPNSLFFNDFLSKKIGNGLLISLLYFVVARQLNLPLIPYRWGNNIVFGVPVQNRIVAAKSSAKPIIERNYKIDFFVLPCQNGKQVSYDQIANEIQYRGQAVGVEFAVLNERQLARFYIEQLADAYEKNKHFFVADGLYSLAAAID